MTIILSPRILTCSYLFSPPHPLLLHPWKACPPQSPMPRILEGPSSSLPREEAQKDSPSNLFDFRLSMLNTFPIIFHCHHYFLCLLFLLLLLCIAFVVVVEAPGGVSAGQAYITTKWCFLFCVVFNYLFFRLHLHPTSSIFLKYLVPRFARNHQLQQ